MLLAWVELENFLFKDNKCHYFFLSRQAHQEIKDGYDRLHRISLSGPESKEFVEPRVQILWNMAVKGNFSDSELESMRVFLFSVNTFLI